jgi:hypothetical protein
VTTQTLAEVITQTLVEVTTQILEKVDVISSNLQEAEDQTMKFPVVNLPLSSQ